MRLYLGASYHAFLLSLATRAVSPAKGARVTKDTEMNMETETIGNDVRSSLPEKREEEEGDLHFLNRRKMEDSSLISTCTDDFFELNEKYADELATLYDDDNACTVMNNWTTCMYYGDTEPLLPKFTDFCDGTMAGKTILMDTEYFQTEDNSTFYFAGKPYCVPKTCVEASYIDVIYKMHNALRFFSFYLKKDMSLKCHDNFGSYGFWMDNTVQPELDRIESYGNTPLIRYQGGKHSCSGGDRTNRQTILHFKEVSDSECLDPNQLFFEEQELWHQEVKFYGFDPSWCKAIVPVTLLEVYEPSGPVTLSPVSSAPVNHHHRTTPILFSFLFSMLAAMV